MGHMWAAQSARRERYWIQKERKSGHNMLSEIDSKQHSHERAEEVFYSIVEEQRKFSSYMLHEITRSNCTGLWQGALWGSSLDVCKLGALLQMGRVEVNLNISWRN